MEETPSTDRLKVFISWSGPLAGKVAEQLGPWLRRVIQLVHPFVSSQGMEKGDVWMAQLLRELQTSSVGIICVTRENLHNDWLLFESGALVGNMGRVRLCTFLIDISPAELEPPLSSFQCTTFKREDVLRMLQTIHSALKVPLLTEKELEDQFSAHWNELETIIKSALAAPASTKSDLQDLANELLLPVIYREAQSGDLDTVFHWLEIAKARKVAPLDSQLAFIESSLARLTGKRGAGQSLRTQSARETELGGLAQIENCYLGFASGRALKDSSFDELRLETLPESPKRTAYALLGLWHLREGRSTEARSCLDHAAPLNFTGEVGEHYRALPMGILCFGLGAGMAGEKQFDIVKRGMTTVYPGYPFASLTSPFDKAFVGACIGHKVVDLSERKIREFRGHAWVLIKYAELMLLNQECLATLSKISEEWQRPLDRSVVSNRLLQFQKKLISAAGAPLLT